ncbi:hypothetical protein ACSNOK_20165 [Streptomyces sp. URMC 126]|uniref:hypothetical protein n=1 Tax=Streptomyces sp. URMC 126 TaxID=3423401 RepID=UPI003F197D88
MGRRPTVRTRRHGPRSGRPATTAIDGVLARDRGWRREAREAWCWGTALGGLLTLVDLLRGELDAARACCWAALGITLVAVLRPPRVTAGDGWLASRGLLRERRVRTDLLTRVRQSDGMAPRLVLRDVGGGRVELDPRVLRTNPLLWHQLESGARRALERGLLREGAPVLAALASRIDGEGVRGVLRASGLE